LRPVEFHPEAQAEFLASARYYEGQAEGLGFLFIASVERTYERLAAFPESGHPFGSRLRRALVPGFPYGIIHRVESDRLFVVAVADLRRRPGYWKGRT